MQRIEKPLRTKSNLVKLFSIHSTLRDFHFLRRNPVGWRRGERQSREFMIIEYVPLLRNQSPKKKSLTSHLHDQKLKASREKAPIHHQVLRTNTISRGSYQAVFCSFSRARLVAGVLVSYLKPVSALALCTANRARRRYKEAAGKSRLVVCYIHEDPLSPNPTALSIKHETKKLYTSEIFNLTEVLCFPIF